MTTATFRRRRRRSELGVTLIELLVAITIMGIGVVGIAVAFANIERDAGISTDQANLEVAMRHAVSYLQTQGYSACAPTSSSYSVPTTIDGVALNASVSVALTKVSSAQWQAGAAVGSGTSEPPLYDCSSGSAQSLGTGVTTCPSTYCDWGVQRLTIKLTSSKTGRVLTRVVFKSIA